VETAGQPSFRKLLKDCFFQNSPFILGQLYFFYILESRRDAIMNAKRLAPIPYFFECREYVSFQVTITEAKPFAALNFFELLAQLSVPYFPPALVEKPVFAIYNNSTTFVQKYLVSNTLVGRLEQCNSDCCIYDTLRRDFFSSCIRRIAQHTRTCDRRYGANGHGG